MQPKCKQLSGLHEKQKVVVGVVCLGTRHGYAELLASISSRKEDPTLDLLTFRREVDKTYLLKKYHQPRSQAGRSSRGKILSANRRISIDV